MRSGNSRRSLGALISAMSIACLVALAASVVGAQDGAHGKQTGWSASGTLLESCTCAVPCTCNFGEGPSPNHFCHAVFAYKLEKARWNGTELSGLVVAGADGPEGSAGYLDSRATPAQRDALLQIAQAIFRQGGPSGAKRNWKSVALVHEVKGNDLTLKIGDKGGFSAKVILGRDRKSPVVVENNTVWPIRRAVKAKSQLAYKDSDAGEISGDGVNANYGAFSFTVPER